MDKTINNACEKQVSEILLNLGFEPHMLGYYYTKEAVKMMVNNPVATIKAGVTKYLYPEIGRRFKATASQVERAIRHSIIKAFRPESPHWQAFYGKDVHPTNSQLIASLTEVIRLKKVS